MKITRNILLIILALFLQASWTNAISLWDIKPDLIVLILVFVGITSGQIEATLLGFFSGFMIDVYNPEWMGMNALSNSLIGFAVGYSRVGVVAEDIQVQATILLWPASCAISFFFFVTLFPTRSKPCISSCVMVWEPPFIPPFWVPSFLWV